MSMSENKRWSVLAWALGIGLVLSIVFAFVEYGLGAREFAREGEDPTPSTTDTTISDTQHEDDARAIREAEEMGLYDLDEESQAKE